MFLMTNVRSDASRSNQLPQIEESGAPALSRSTPYRSHKPYPAFASLPETNHASWKPPLETRGQRGELSDSASTGHRYAPAKTPSTERASLVQFQPSFLPGGAGLRDLRGGDRVHVPGRRGLQGLPRQGPGLARFRRDLRVRGDPRRRPRLCLGDGRPRVGEGTEAGRAAVAPGAA